MLDAIAHTRVKTPTAAAEFLIARMGDAYDRILELQNEVNGEVRDRLDAESRKLELFTERIPLLMTQRLEREKSRTELLQAEMVSRVRLMVSGEKNKLQVLTARIPQYARNMIEGRRMRLDFLKENILNAEIGRAHV